MTTLVFLFAFLIRLIGLNQSLWLDEAIVAKVVRTVPFHLIPFQFSPSDFHPPLYYLFISVWSKLLGTSEIALRFPSVIASLLAGWVVYKIGLLLGDRKKALWSAIFFLFNPLVVYYSQEARMYMMATLFTTTAFYFFLRLIKEKKQSATDIVFFNIFCALSIFTFYGTLFFIAGMIIVSVISTKRSARRDLSASLKISLLLSVGVVLSLILLFPLLLSQLHTARVGLVDVKNWSMVLGKAEIKNVAMIFLKFVIGRLSWLPKWNYYLVAGIATVLVWICVAMGARKNKMLIPLFFIPLLLAFCVSFWAPMVQYFRFLYLIPVMSIFLGASVISTKRQRMERSYLSRFLDFARNDIQHITLFFFIAFSFTYLLLPQFHREDWKNLARQLNPKEPVFIILPSGDPVTYYNPAVSLFELRKLGVTNVPEEIQVIPYVEEIYGINHNETLNKMGCLKIESSILRGPLLLEKWRCLKNS